MMVSSLVLKYVPPGRWPRSKANHLELLGDGMFSMTSIAEIEDNGLKNRL
jgi:hypothetical protein